MKSFGERGFAVKDSDGVVHWAGKWPAGNYTRARTKLMVMRLPDDFFIECDRGPYEDSRLFLPSDLVSEENRDITCLRCMIAACRLEQEFANEP